MTESSAIRYVNGLADVVLDPESGLSPEKALEELQSFSGVLAESRELRSVLVSPAIQPADKYALLEEIGTGLDISPVVRSFLCVLTDHHCVAQFDLVVRGFRSWLDRYRNRIAIRVCSASEMDPAQKSEIEGRFRRLTGRDVRPGYSVDPDLLGGASVQVGSKLYDGSLRAALGSLAAELVTG